jgi:phosphocarrier protein FPr
MVQQMVGSDFPIAVAAGVGDDHENLGTDAIHISEILLSFCQEDGAVVLMDLGSAVLSAQTALELLDRKITDKLRLCPAPIVEAAVVAAVASSVGADLDSVANEALIALSPKITQLGTLPISSISVASNKAVGDHFYEIDVTVNNTHGLHARPAAMLVQLINKFHSDVQLTNLSNRRGPSSARSLTSIALLQIRKGDKINFSVNGEDARSAINAIQKLAYDNFGETLLTLTKQNNQHKKAITIAISEGIAIGKPLIWNAPPLELDDVTIGTKEQEKKKFNDAIRQVTLDLSKSTKFDDTKIAILSVQKLILNDPVLLTAVEMRLSSYHCSAALAWRIETDALIASYDDIEDEYLRARVADLRDIATRVLTVILGKKVPSIINPESPTILLIDELFPSTAMLCDSSNILGFIAKIGNLTAHATIIIRSLGIPMIVCPNLDFSKFSSNTVLAFDGSTGEIWIDPDASTLTEIEARKREFLATRYMFENDKMVPAVTIDQQHIEVLANIGNENDVMCANENGADGVGLLRTEFLYLGLTEMPDEENQTKLITKILNNLNKGSIVIRTPDIGADKPLAFMPIISENNPFLGVRGLRLSLRYPDFFTSNLRAILRAGINKDVRIMFPMVTMIEEWHRAYDLVKVAHLELKRLEIDHLWPIKLGMMIEVPAAAIMAEKFAGFVDFFSIGTNDLTQYILAAERGNSDLDMMQDATHPAVLRAIHEICEKVSSADRHVSVCGDAASDPIAAILMIGAGIRSLSVRPNQIPIIKALIRTISIANLNELVQEAMCCDTAIEARMLVKMKLGALSPAFW